MKSGAVVLLSGGLDSTVNFYATLKEANVKMALTFDYGQKAAKKEIEAATTIAKDVGCAHTVINLDWFKGLGKSALNTDAVNVPKIKSTSLDDKDLTLR